MIVIIDNYDSFTYNLYDYVQQHGRPCKLYRNDEISMEELEEMQPEAFIFSPGPKRPKDHPLMFDILGKYAEELPILGICLGHQAIAEYYGGKLEKGPVPAHGKTCLLQHESHDMYKGIPSPVEVGRYHSLIISQPLPKELVVTGKTAEGLVMSFSHKQLPLWGMQFHPESVLTRHGMQMIGNWIALFS